MTSIQDILEDLRVTASLKGCLVMMHDGIVVATALDRSLEGDVVSGLTSFLTSTLRRVLTESGLGGFTSLTVHSTHGKVLMVDIGTSYLVVTTNQFGRLDLSMPEIQEAALQLRRLSRISL
ncbi:MAG: roadblock/LC7 domain-containing protein [Planctomycetes bacterium]|nr:roadblock/LC7 domain-containing protein [Planctomycetota bacterium]MCB9870684.1 roadblock/LC7 domain-containing protein [Planctomycetota bacterium]